ncbi:hypothetical protein AKO1_013084 [Acrasis kona]|uniref:Oxysterol-binding protein n=1 Tax=Acrasis kona TaxID=1008807 RepID=A0AAW2YZ28_9EUKA
MSSHHEEDETDSSNAISDNEMVDQETGTKRVLSPQEEEENLYHGQSEDDVETLGSETKSLLMTMMGQLKIGMDLTKIPIPCDFLEPRSLLEKLTDFTTHCQILNNAMDFEDPEQRMLEVTRWYLSGWHVKPKGVKKPYNPVLGEIFRCNYFLPDGSVMTCAAEQVSHHPPISALYCENQTKGLTVEGWYYPRSKFLGNSAASIADGLVKITFKERGEIYSCTWANIYARGVIFGKLIMEVGGKTSISCKKTGMSAEIDFKTKPMFGGEYNGVSAKIKKKGHTTHTISGKWNNVLTIKKRKMLGSGSNEEEFFNARTCKIMHKNVPLIQDQLPNESRRLWVDLTAAINSNNVQAAAEEKNKVETSQRELRKVREDKCEVHKPVLFRQGPEDFWTFIGHEHPFYVSLTNKDLSQLGKVAE